MPAENWASLEDFATLFQYFWYRDFPMDAKRAIGARRVDWTIHIGIVVRNIADLMGFVTRFEAGGRKDAVLRSTEGDEIAIEWEWEDILGKEGKLKGNELRKLQNRKVWRPNDKEGLKYAVLITYTHTYNIDKVYERVLTEWKEAPWPLLLILIDVEESKKFFSHKEFMNMQMSLFCEGKRTELRSAPALPWKVPKTRWSRELK